MTTNAQKLAAAHKKALNKKVKAPKPVKPRKPPRQIKAPVVKVKAPVVTKITKTVKASVSSGRSVRHIK